MKTILIINNCISDIIKQNQYKEIFVYGSENLELEKFIYKSTSSPIIGGDVDFCNVLLGQYFSGVNEITLDEEIYKTFNLDIGCKLNLVEKLALAIIYKTCKPKTINEHTSRIFNNIINNKDILISDLKNQINKIFLHIKDFKECILEEFIKEITFEDLLIIDCQKHNYINEKLINTLQVLNAKFVIISKKDINFLKQYRVMKSQNINIFSNINISPELISTKPISNTNQKSFNVVDNEIDDNISIKQLSFTQFNALRQKYLSKKIHIFGTPKVCYGLFSNDLLFGVFGLTNEFRNKPPKELEKPCVYLLSDFSVTSNIKKLSKLVLYCILSKEVKQLAERLLNKEVKTIYTNVFTNNMSSVKYRDLFVLQNRKQLEDGSYNLTYTSKIGEWTLKEGIEKWKLKL